MPTGYCSACTQTWPYPPGSPCPIHNTPLESIGILRFVQGQALLDDVLLARSGPDPLRAAADFLTARGIQSGERIQVTGTEGMLGEQQVIFVESVRRSLLETA